MARSSEQHERLASIFEERAENLSKSELEEWTTHTTRDEASIAKLMGPGAKLLSGPRGSGKSTLFRTAYFRLAASRESLPVYVNYSRSLALEPLFHRQANALQLFRQWILTKIVVGAAEAFNYMGLTMPPDLRSLSAAGQGLIRQLATGASPDELKTLLSPSDVVDLLETWADASDLRRCVLLLDDAAHVFSPEQQREFFEVFRELRSRRVSPKAAVYPGITSYSPFFHVGHEAETIEAWYRPDDSDYLEVMRSIVDRRLPPELAAQLTDKKELVDLLALASFGLPRGFLNMLSELLAVGEPTSPKPTRQRAERAVATQAENVRGIFRALSNKLPRYRHFVAVGRELDAALVRTLAAYNRLQLSPDRKTTIVAIEEPLNVQIERMLNMLEYAGVVRKADSVSRGVKGRFQRYTIHTAIVIAENALVLGKSYPLSNLIDALRLRVSHAFSRTKPTSLLGVGFEERCTLALPPCKKCGTARVAEEQHFCMKCGSELSDASVYEELLRTPIQHLPLTQKKIEGILQHTTIRTVHDLLIDEERQDIRKVRGVGPLWAKRIRTIAEEFIGV